MRNTPDWEAEREANASWGWILGGLAAVALVLVALSFARNDTQTASNSGSNEPPISQTRPANPTVVNPSTANRPTPAPAPSSPAPSSPSTTGQSGSSSQ
jgi:hypothetical protein